MNSNNSVVDLNEQGSIDDQAAYWVARLDGERPAPSVLVKFKYWINQSPAHKNAFEDYVALWDEMNVATQLVPPSRQRSNWRSLVVCWRDWQFGPRWALASTVLLGLLALQLLMPAALPEYRTAVGEQLRVELPDGSKVLLNTNTHLLVRYSDGRRRIELHKGEALFDVAHNPGRPFEVYAGKGLVRAIGTAFSVYLRPSDVEVVVTEGVVEIDSQATAATNADSLSIQSDSTNPDDGSALEAIAIAIDSVAKQPSAATAKPRVKAGGIATFDRHTAQHVQLAALEKRAQKTAWHEGFLIFDDEPLQQVIDQLERYTRTRFVIPEQSLREFKVGGQFKVGDTDSMLEALQVSFSIDAQRIDEQMVYLVQNKDKKL